MSERPTATDFQPLEPTLQSAVDVICSASMSEQAIQRIADKALVSSTSRPASSPMSVEKGKPFSKVFLSGSLAASVLLVMALAWHTLSASRAWAQVLDAVSERPWMRLVLQRPDGEPPEGETIPDVTMWLDGDRQRAALDAPSGLHWLDLLDSKSYRYDEESGRIRVGKVDEREGEQVLLLLMVLHQFDAASGILDQDSMQLKSSNRSRVVWNEKSLEEYQFVFQQTATNSQHVMRVQVDDERRRPVRLIIDRQHRSKELLSQTFTIDYPDVGPSDIYAMGAPLSASVDDVQPLAEYFPQTQTDETTTYQAVEIISLVGMERKWINGVQRFEFGEHVSVAERADLNDVIGLSTQVYYGDSDGIPTGRKPGWDWWLNACGDLNYESFDASGGANFPHQRCYAAYGSIDLYDSVHISTLKGLEGTVELRGPKRSTWVDPNRDGIVRRWEAMSADGTIDVRQNDEIIQAPNGVWFATRWRSGRVERRGAPLTDKSGGVSTTVHECRFEF